MCGPIGKMNAEVSHAAAGKKIGEVKSVARALPGLECRPIFPLVKIDKSGGPLSAGLRFLFPDMQNLLRGCVANRCAQSRDVFVSQTGERRINGANFERPSKPFQSQHLHVAKGVRDNRVT